MKTKETFQSVLLFLSLVTPSSAYTPQEDTLISPYVLDYVKRKLPDTFFPHPEWNPQTSGRFFYVEGDFNNDKNVDVAVLLFKIDTAAKGLKCFPTFFAFRNGIVENHIVLDTLGFDLSASPQGFTVELQELKITHIQKGEHPSNCGGEHIVQIPYQSITVSVSFSAFAYVVRSKKVEKVCLFLD